MEIVLKADYHHVEISLDNGTIINADINYGTNNIPNFCSYNDDGFYRVFTTTGIIYDIPIRKIMYVKYF